MRLIAVAGLSLAVAGCGAGSVAASGGASVSAPVSASTAPTSAASPTTPPPAATGASSAPPSGPSSVTATCAPAQVVPAAAAGVLTGVEFVSPTQGWAVGQNAIMATTDGGSHWTTQLSGKLNLTSVDFVTARDGFAVGTTSLLATTDGGAHWTARPEPCAVIRSVHFISPKVGFAVAGGRNGGGGQDQEPTLPVLGGVVLTTSDRGQTWHSLPAPANAQSDCFSDANHGWVGADGELDRTADGGQTWTVTTTPDKSADSGPGVMTVECAGNGSAWAERIGPGVGMSQAEHVGYHADQAGTTAIFAEQYFGNEGTGTTAQSPGSDAGPFSAINAAQAAFIDSCTACGAGTAPWDLASNSGATLTKEGNVGAITVAEAASFASPLVGWVVGAENTFPATGSPKSQQRIVFTSDGGRTWHLQWSGPWSTSTG